MSETISEFDILHAIKQAPVTLTEDEERYRKVFTISVEMKFEAALGKEYWPSDALEMHRQEKEIEKGLRVQMARSVIEAVRRAAAWSEALSDVGRGPEIHGR